jgi:uncharacterized protein (UPF0297 family)
MASFYKSINKNLQKISLLFLLAASCITMQSCGKWGEQVAIKYSYSMSRLTRQDAPYEIRIGLYEGCVTGTWAKSNPFYRYLTSYKQNPNLVYNEVYKYAWNRAYNVCSQMANIDGYTIIGSKAWLNRFSDMFNLEDGKNWKDLPIGGDAAYAPNWVLDESSNNGIPGFADSNKVNNFFGFWGTCKFCPS